MEQRLHRSPNRLVFFDNLRSLMVLLVLVFHSGVSYGSMVGFWPYHDPHPTEFVDILLLLLDVFMMSILFFIAGYFALPSLRKEGGRRFIGDKFKRLGIPWLVVTVLVLPVLDYAHYYTRSIRQGLAPRDYGTHWWLSMIKIAQFTTGPMRMSGYLDMTQHYYQRYVWFLSLLLLFCVVLWLLDAARQKWGRIFERPPQKKGAADGSVWRALAWTGLVSILLFALIKLLASALDNPFDMAWFSLGNLVQFEAAKLAFYVPYFGLGIYAYSQKWFVGSRDFGKPWIWGAICFLLLVINMLVGRSMSRADEPSLGLQVAFVVLYPLWTLSFLVMFTAFASRRWNKATVLGRELAGNSYTMYLGHYAFVMILPLLLSGWTGIPSLVKFGVVALATVSLSFGASKYILKPFPGLVTIGLAGFNVLLSILSMVLFHPVTAKESDMTTEYRTDVSQAVEQPSLSPSGTVDARITQVENSLVPMSANGQPQWGSICALAERMAYYQVPGVSVAVIDAYQLDWAKGYGVRVAGGDEAVTAQTPFHAGSVAKSLSAAATLTLVEQGLLSLDEDVNDRLVSWRVPENEYTGEEKVTLRRLLSHSAGLKDGLTDRGPDDAMPAYVTFGDDLPAVTLQQLLEGMPEDDIEPTWVVQVPGTGYRYTNADYAILELLVEDRIGQAFEDLMQNAVLDRLGMAHSSYRQPLPPQLEALSAREHTLDGKPVTGGRANFPFHAAGSLWTTPGDLALFMIDLMQAFQGESGHLLSPQMAQQMLSPQIEIRDNPLSDAFGLGVELQRTSQGPKVWHTGGTWGSCSIIWFYPQIGKGAVVMTNSASGSLLRFEILLSIALAYGWPMG